MSHGRLIAAWLWAGAPAALIYLAHLWFGANSSFAALVLAAAEALMLLVLLSAPHFRPRLGTTPVLGAAASCFLAVLVASALSLSPLVPGGPHPVWNYVPGTPASGLDRAAALIELVKLLGFAAIFLVGVLLSRSDRTANRARKAMVWLGALYGLIALALFLGRNSANPDGRLTGDLSSANCAATVFAMLAILVLPSLLPGKQPESRRRPGQELLNRLPGAALFVLFGACLVLTASRGGLVSALVGVGVFLVLRGFAGRIGLKAAAASAALLGAALVCLLLFKGALLIERFGAMPIHGDPRAAIFAEHWAAFLKAPLSGYGLGTFAEVNRLLLDAGTYSFAWQVRDLHNVYLQWLEEGGLLAALPMFTCLTLMIGFSLSGLISRRRGQSWLAALLAVDAVMLSHSMTDFALQIPSIAAMWSLLLGLQLGFASSIRRIGRLSDAID